MQLSHGGDAGFHITFGQGTRKGSQTVRASSEGAQDLARPTGSQASDCNPRKDIGNDSRTYSWRLSVVRSAPSIRQLTLTPGPNASERMALPHMRAVRLLGRVFDMPGVYHRFERPALDLSRWCRWSVRWLWKLSDSWRAAHNA